MAHRRLALACLAWLGIGISGCDFFYNVQASVPLTRPIDVECLKTRLGPESKEALTHSRETHNRGSSITAESFSTNAMFHDRWETVTQQSHHDSSVFLGTVYKDTSATLSGMFVSVNRRFEANRGAAMGEEILSSLLSVRDACGGQSPVGERPYSIQVNEVPFESWGIAGTGGHVSMRVTVDGREYTGPIVRKSGRYTLHVDTLVQRAGDTREAKRVEVDRLQLPVLSEGTVLATECWRGDSAAAGTLVAQVHGTDEQYWTHVVDAWALEPSSFHIHETSATNVECLNRHYSTQFPEAPGVMRLAAIRFRPSPSASRIYVYLGGYSLESNVATVMVDSAVIGQLDGGSYLMVEIPPGKHTVAAVTAHHRNELPLDLRPDSSAFIQLHWIKWSWTQQARIELDTTATVRDRIRGGHMVASTWRLPGSGR